MKKIVLVLAFLLTLVVAFESGKEWECRRFENKYQACFECHSVLFR